MKRIAMLFAMLFAMPLFAGPGGLILAPQTGNDLTLAWDQHAEAAQITEFWLYRTTTSGVYAGPPVSVFPGGATTTGLTPKPTTAGRYYYTLTAAIVGQSYALESSRSNEINYDVLPAAPTLRSILLQLAQALRDAYSVMAEQLALMPESP